MAQKTRKKTESIMVLSDSQREVIANSSSRLEIIDAIFGIAPCTVAELAEELARTPQSLYYHVNMLVEAGLLKQVGTKKAGKRDEAIYEPVAEHFRLAPGRDQKATREAMISFNSTVLRLTDRNYRAAFDQGLIRVIDGRQNYYTRRQRAWLTDKDLLKVYEHIDAIGQILLKGNKKREGQAYSLTTILSPLTPEPAENPAGD